MSRLPQSLSARQSSPGRLTVFMESHNHDSPGTAVCTTRLSRQELADALRGYVQRIPASAPRTKVWSTVGAQRVPTRAAKCAAVRAAVSAAEAERGL